MKFGFAAPPRAAIANPESMTAIARKGEELGFGFISVSDHLVIPRSIASRIPTMQAGSTPAAPASVWVSHLTLGFGAGTLEGTMDRLERFATDVKPLAA